MSIISMDIGLHIIMYTIMYVHTCMCGNMYIHVRTLYMYMYVVIAERISARL